MSLVEYLFRVTVYLLAFAGIGVTSAIGLRTRERLHSKSSGPGEGTEAES